MQFFPNSQTFLKLGPLTIQWYAMLILFGALLFAYFSYREMKKANYSREFVEDLIMGCFIVGIIGARLWYCVFYDLEGYMAEPLRILKIYEGGLAIQGGLLAGALYGFWYARKHKANFFRLADMIVPNLLLAQAIGRWGNFVNKEAHGGVVSEAYFNHFPNFIKEGMLINGQYYSPTFLYESVLNVIGFVAFVFIIRKLNDKYHILKRGDGLYFYLIWYGCSRYIVEGLRTDSLMLGNMRMAQLTSVVFVVVGFLGMLGLFRKIFKDKKPVVLFDLDGTLLDTEPAIIESYRHLFSKYKTEVEFTKEIQVEVLGPTLAQMFKKYFPEKDTEKLIEEYKEYNFKIHPEKVGVMNHAKEILTQLKEDGYDVGIVSSKFRDGIQLGLDLHHLTELVDTIVGLDDVKEGKPNPEGIVKACHQMNRGFDDCLYIGDSATDIETAHRAGVYSVAYISKEEKSESLHSAKPNRIIYDLAEIKELLKEDHVWTYNMM
ncbi:MAG: prolipoprotein diacylglyceryl transferase [Anaerorhabdus sp.]